MKTKTTQGFEEGKVSEKNWTGNKKSTYVTLGASNHTKAEREINDYYATEPRVIEELFSAENFDSCIWECACGEGHLSKEMDEYDKQIYSTDIVDRGYGDDFFDFLESDIKWVGDIITNPPYKYAMEFVQKALKSIENDRKVAMFLKLTFLEGQKRYTFFKENPPYKIYVYSSRRQCGKNGIFRGSSAACYAWFIWVKGFKGRPTLDWII